MSSRDQFGPYLLLKKLNEDALGETFRAGRVEGQTIEQVLLLRVFDGQGLDGGQLWQAVAERGAQIQQSLKSPNIGSGVDVDEMGGVPYVAYDYISGTDVASLMEQADKQMSPLPLDHALLISERVALGLAAAYETRVADQRVVHGFVVPDLVMISSEGEARLLGFEVGAGLRSLAPMSPAVRSFGRYLPPEALEGKPPHKSDDVYSLGVLLFELLTGKQIPQGLADATGALTGAMVAHDEEPIPAPIVGLLEKSLAPRDQRISDAVTWHKQLSQLMIEGQYNPTTFNLAFFMHSLFRDEIERENREMQSERNLDAQAKTVAIPILEVAPEDATEEGAAPPLETAPTPPPPEKKSKAGLWIAAAVVLALLGGGAYYFFVVQGQGGEEVAETPPPTQPAAQPQLPTGPTQEEIQADLDRLQQEMQAALDQRGKELSEQYESRLKDLEAEYQRQQDALAERKRQEEEAEAARLAQEEADRLAEEEAARKAQEEAEAKRKAEEEKNKPRPQDQVAKIENTSPPPPPPSRPKPPPEPQVKVGELVQPGPGVVPPRTLKQVTPTYPPAARRFLRKAATVVVRVLVDENGQVVRAEREGEKAGMGLDEAAIDAAKEFRFQPATKRGVPVKMWHSLRFAFDPS